MQKPQWQIDAEQQQQVVEEARRLPRGRVDGWVRVLFGAAVLAWLASLAYGVATLPARVPTHFGVSGGPDGWSSRAGALAFMAIFPIVICAVVLAVPLLVRYFPDGINLPNLDDKRWWLSTPERLVEFERRLRSDMTVMTASMLLMFALVFVMISVASQRADHAMAWWGLPATLAIIGAGVAYVLWRAFTAYRRPADSPGDDRLEYPRGV